MNYQTLLETLSESLEAMVNPVLGVPLASWRRFSDLTGGLRPHELTLICAPTGAGKTQFNACISIQLLTSRVPHFVASVETGRVDYVIRMISALTGKDYNTGVAHPISEIETLVKRYEAVLKTNNVILSTYENRVSVEDMLATLREVHEKFGCKIAILDNLNFFLQVTSSTMEKAEMDNAMHSFVMEVKKLPMHIILVVHPRKTDDGRVTSEFDIKGSSTAVQEAQNVFLLNRPDPDDIESGLLTHTDRELWIKKFRKRGSLVGQRFYFGFDNGAYFEKGLRNELQNVGSSRPYSKGVSPRGGSILRRDAD